jgi:RNA polymerase sigma factor (sigma-70 family)
LSDAFPATHASAVRGAASDDPATRDQARETLVAAYWRPVYKYVRIRWRLPREDAEDLVQGFFARALDKDWFARYDPARARFRTFLRTCLDAYVANEQRDAAREKRGGLHPHVPLDVAAAEEELRLHPIVEPVDADELFHLEWIRTLFARAVEALRAHVQSTGRVQAFALFERYDLADPDSADRPTYRQLAVEFDLPETQVTNLLAAMRRDFRRAVLVELRALCGSESEFRAEARSLWGEVP